MTLNYMVYHYDGSRNAVAMTDMADQELVIDFDKAEAQVMFNELEKVGWLARYKLEDDRKIIVTRRD